jgi:chromatin remodeling complex protein RSC6
MPTAKKAATPTTPAAKKAPPAKVIKAAEVVTPTPVVEKVVEVVKPDQPAAPQENVLSNIVEKVNAFVTMGKELQGLVKVLSKEYEKQQKIIEKVQKKRQNAKNSPSGFAKPNKISDELCDFIGEPRGTEKSRTDITRFINAYIKEHTLNKPENKRFILPDEKLRKILNVKENEEINYFILQKLISHHFPPSASKLAAAAAAAAK